jgi:hypothetical protein
MKISPGGMARWTSHPPQEQKTRVRIPPGYRVFRENKAMLFCLIDLICIVCVLKKRNNLQNYKNGNEDQFKFGKYHN